MSKFSFSLCKSENSNCHVHKILFILLIQIAVAKFYYIGFENQLDTQQNHCKKTENSTSKRCSENFKIFRSEYTLITLAVLGLHDANNSEEIFKNANFSDRNIGYSNRYEDLIVEENYSDSFNSTGNGKAGSNELNSTLEDYAEVSDELTLEERRRQDGFELTTPEQYPYSVLLVMKYSSNKQGVCTGSLLTAEWVLTAAHCLMLVNTVIIYAGGYSLKDLTDGKVVNGSQSAESSEFYPHPHYKAAHDFDVGLIKVQNGFKLTDTVNTVNLSTDPWSYRSYYKCVITGFGVVQVDETNPEDQKRKTHFLMVKQPCLCKFKFGLLLGTKKASRYICAKPAEDYGVCPGDSGGGLVCDGKIKGIAMQIIFMRDLDQCDMSVFGVKKCGAKNTFSIFEDTCPFLHWINSHVKLFKDNEISEKCVEPVGGCQSKNMEAVYLVILLLFIINMFVSSYPLK